MSGIGLPQANSPGASPMGGGATPPGGGTGAVTAMRPMMGSGAQALTLVHTGLEALQKSLVGLPMGSELHTAVLKAITDISRRMQSPTGDKGAQLQALAAMGRELQQNPQAAAMQRMGGQPQPPMIPGGAGPGQ